MTINEERIFRDIDMTLKNFGELALHLKDRSLRKTGGPTMMEHAKEFIRQLEVEMKELEAEVEAFRNVS